ncbi:FGFR1-like protein [Mya arenaria]|uniref:FGFR1-like protein n=1 Tax=Mya arenaria TaxID=6604 RepID=A0ABY7FRY1_MYAAR|nr:FGFR1-like protein [Mya arenaria]
MSKPHLYEQVQCGPWEITKANLVLTSDRLGQGQFGQVRKAYLKNIRSHDVPVAVKSLKVNASEKDKTDFMNELMILKKVGHHPNVVCLVGSCNIGGERGISHLEMNVDFSQFQVNRGIGSELLG